MPFNKLEEFLLRNIQSIGDCLALMLDKAIDNRAKGSAGASEAPGELPFSSKFYLKITQHIVKTIKKTPGTYISSRKGIGIGMSEYRVIL